MSLDLRTWYSSDLSKDINSMQHLYGLFEEFIYCIFVFLFKLLIIFKTRSYSIFTIEGNAYPGTSFHQLLLGCKSFNPLSYRSLTSLYVICLSSYFYNFVIVQ